MSIPHQLRRVAELVLLSVVGVSIILTASQMGRVAYAGSSAYCTTKGALL